MRNFWYTLFIAAFLLAACGPAATPVQFTATSPAPTSLLATASPEPSPTPQLKTTLGQRTLTVFAAASLTDAFNEIGKDFSSANPGVAVRFNYAGSQTLRTQLEQGGVADVFASANTTEMDTVTKDGLVAANSSKIFLTNILQVILPPGNPGNIQGLADLARPGIKVDLADPSVPVGKYARQLLANLDKDPAFGSGFSAKVLANVVSNETDVKQVVAKVQLGEVDAGIVYISDAIAAPQLKTIQIPAADNVVAKYPIAALTKAPYPDLATAFINYVLSANGQAILKKWGFTPVTP